MAALIAAVIAAFLVGIGAVLVVFRQYAARRGQAARERFPDARAIVPGANFFGLESRGAAQLRGNGTLVLTDQEIFFERWVVRMEIRIPLNAIVAVDTPMSHLGKSVARRLLKVTFRGADGQNDSIAWYVPDLEGLKRTLEGLLPG